MQDTHRTLIGRLGRDQRRALTARSDGAGLRHLAGHWGAILVIGSMVALAVPYWPLLLPIQGILIAFLFTPLHETIHRTAFRSKWLNDAVAEVCGFLVFLPPRWFRRFHFDHHRFTSDPAQDPELAVPKPSTLVQYLFYLTSLPVWWFLLRTLFRNAMGWNADAFVDGPARREIRNEARAYIAGYGALALLSVATGSTVLLWTWVVPILLGQPFLRAYLLAEHAGCPASPNMLVNSRTTFTTTIVRWLAWNMPYHAEHHAFPSVPFHKLPEFHRLTRDHLGSTSDGYWGFHRGFIAGLTR